MNKEQENLHKDIWAEIRSIKENHLIHIEVNLAKVTNDVSWLTKYHWIIATASIGALIAGIINLLK